MGRLLKLYETMADSAKQHAERVSFCAGIMAKYAMPDLQAEYGLSEDKLSEAVRVGGLYHDIGALYYKPFVLILDRDDMEQTRVDMLRSHTADGYKLIKKHNRFRFKKDKMYIRVIEDMALYHHEWYDGSESMYGLSGNKIPSAAGLCALANKLDGLCETFFINGGNRFEFIAGLIESQSGRCYAPELLDWFVAAKDELAAFYATQDIKPTRKLQHA